MDYNKMKLEVEAGEQILKELAEQRAAEFEALRDRKAKQLEKETELKAEIELIKRGKEPAPDAFFKTKVQVSDWLRSQGLNSSSKEYLTLYKKYSEGLPIQ